jgi:hypothetical protein
MTIGGEANSLGRLIAEISERNAQHVSNYLIVSRHGKRMTATMLRKRWDVAREKARLEAIKLEMNYWPAGSGTFSSGISGQRQLHKLLMSVKRACCWDTPKETSPSEFIAASAPSPGRQNNLKMRSITQSRALVECGL